MSDSPPPNPSPPDPTAFRCPYCGSQILAAIEGASNLTRCQQCGEQFFLAPDSSEEAEEYDDNAPAVGDLDGRRITQHAALKRAIWRSRTYAIVFAIGFGLIVSETLWRAVAEARRHGLSRWMIAYLAVGASSAWISWIAWRRALALHSEGIRSALTETIAAPDFSGLSDGSQTARHLDEMH